MPPLAGQTIGQYRIIEQIGRGGMATVYKAFQPSMERYVAIKLLPEQLAAEDPTFIERFRQEAKVIAQLEHPHILPVYDYGEQNGLTYMVMRYMDSGTLTARLKKPIEWAEIVRLLGQVAEALDYTHSRGVVHRDIKPSNVLIDSRGQALLTDFGIARLVEGTPGLTGRDIIGTPLYMSPEQAQGRPVDGRSDIYSLGVMLYEALVGQPPFEAETPVAVLLKHVHEPLPLPHTVSPAMEQVILKALAKAPADRYQAAGDMKRAMERALTSAGQGLTRFSTLPAAASAPTPVSTAQAIPAADHLLESRRDNRQPMKVGLTLLALILGVILIGGGATIWAFQAEDADKTTDTEVSPEMTAAASSDDPARLGAPETPTVDGEVVAPAETTEAPAVSESGSDHHEPVDTAVTETPASAVTLAAVTQAANNEGATTGAPVPTVTPTPLEPAVTLAAAVTVAPAVPPTGTPEEVLAGINVTDNPGMSDSPSLALDGNGVLHLGWWDKTTGRNLGDFLHRRMTPDGQWSESEILTTDFETIIGNDRLELIRNPATGQVCAFWQGAITNSRPDTIGLYRRCWADGGWSPTEKVHAWSPPGNYFAPAFAPDGTLHVAQSNGPFAIVFGDAELSDGVKTVDKVDMTIDQAGGLHVVWVRQGQPFSIEYRYSNDNGQIWQATERLTDDQNAGAGTVGPLRIISDSQGDIHLVFVSQNRGIFYRRWRPDGGWGPSVELTQGKPSSSSTSIEITADAGGRPHVLWHGLWGLFYTHMLEDESWSKPRLIADVSGAGPGPVMVVGDDGVRHFVWQVENDAVDLYYAALP